MTAATLVRERTPDRPGPGPIPTALLRALDLRIGRRVDGLLAGEHRTSAIGVGTELAQIREWEPGDDVRRIDWNATARTHEVQVRVDVAERALTSWVAARRLALDAVRDRRPPQVGRRRGSCRGAGPPRLAAREPDRRRDLRRRATALTLPPRQGRAGLLGVLLAVRREPETERVGRRRSAPALDQRRADRAAAIPGRRRLRLPRPAGLAGAAAAPRSAARGRRGRDPRPARAGAAERRPHLARRSRDRPAAPGRHRAEAPSRAVREAAAAERDDLARELTSSRRPASRPLHGRRLAPPVRGVPRARKEATMSFATPWVLWGLLIVPIGARRLLARAAPAEQVRGAVHEPRPAGEHRRRVAGAPPPHPGAAGARLARRAGRGDGAAAGGRRGAAGRRHRRSDDGQLGVDDGDRRRADAARRGEVGRIVLPRQAARNGSGSASSRSPARCRCWRSRRTTATRSGRRSTRSRGTSERRSATRSSRRSGSPPTRASRRSSPAGSRSSPCCCSPTARTRPGASR